MRKGQATEPVRTRSCRVVKSEAGGRFTRHISPGVLVRRAATSGDRGALSGYVSCLWCSGRQHATCTFVSSRRRAGKPTPAVGLRDLPLPEAGVCPPPSEKRCALNADSDLRMDIVIERGGLRDASASDFRHKSILIGVTYAYPQAGVHLRAGSPDQDGSAASTSEARKRNHYARVGHVSFDERSHKLVTLAVQSFGRLGREGSKLIDQLATNVVGGRDGGAMAKKDICKERPLQIVSVTSQVAISRRVHRYKLTLRDRQAARGRREEEGGLMPMAWGCHIDAE